MVGNMLRGSPVQAVTGLDFADRHQRAIFTHHALTGHEWSVENNVHPAKILTADRLTGDYVSNDLVAMSAIWASASCGMYMSGCDLGVAISSTALNGRLAVGVAASARAVAP